VNDHKPLTRAQWFVLVAAFLGWMFDGLEQGLFPIAARPALQDLLEMPSEQVIGQWSSYLMVAFLLGAAGGGLVFGWLGDRIGRVRTMALTILVYSVFTGICYFATDPWQLAFCRFFAALGMGGEWALGVALIMECWPEKLRPLLAGVIGSASNFGFLSIALVSIFFQVKVDSWRWIMMVGAVPGILAFLVLAFVPESERWKEAVKTSAAKPLREIFTTGLVKPTILGTIFASVALIGTWAAVSGFLPQWADQLAGGERTIRVTATVRPDARRPLEEAAIESTKATRATDADGAKYPVKKNYDAAVAARPGERFEYRVTVSNLGSAPARGLKVVDLLPVDAVDPASVSVDPPSRPSVQVSPADGTLTWDVGDLEAKNARAKGWVTLAIAIGAILGCFVGPLWGHQIGRRQAYFYLCLVSLATCGLLFRTPAVYDALFLGTVFVVGLFTASFYGWLPLYLPELFPSRVRATGQGVAYNTGRIFAALGALTMGQLMRVFDGSYARACATITLIYVLGMVVIWLGPETKGKPLPE
jgi:uncharacterized repeat protein (TIGR01451 family)